MVVGDLREFSLQTTDAVRAGYATSKSDEAYNRP